MKVSYDPRKRAWTQEHRGLDFEDAGHVFGGRTLEYIDDRRDYGEVRWITFGPLDGRLVVLVWTARGETRHIISMRKANGRERKIYEAEMG